MAHDHHRCECKHGRVKFCAKCKVVHCLECKMEWTHEPCTRSHTTYSYPWVSYGVGSQTVGNLATQGTSLLNPTNATIDCEH